MRTRKEICMKDEIQLMNKTGDSLLELQHRYILNIIKSCYTELLKTLKIVFIKL